MVLSQPELADSGQALAASEQRLAAIERDLAPLKAQRNAESSRLLEQSLLGRLGRAIEPIVRPLGWDWRIGVGVLASFPAREVIVSTLGTIYSLGGEEEGLEQALHSATWPDGRPVYSIPVALSIMVFFALCAQCASTLMVIHRETNDWRWALFAFVYMTGLAYLGALLTYQVSRLWFG
jgi:ferrous iron transport protein B